MKPRLNRHIQRDLEVDVCGSDWDQNKKIITIAWLARFTHKISCHHAGSLATYKRRLKLAIDEENRPNNESSEPDGDESEEGETDDYGDDAADNSIQASQEKARTMYPLLTRLASDVCRTA